MRFSKTMTAVLEVALIAILAALLTACRQEPGDSVSTAVAQLTPASPIATEMSPLPTTTVVSRGAVPTPSEGAGVVFGRLVDESGQPVSSLKVYLARVWPLETEGGVEDALLMDTAQSPAALTDESGRFVFTEVAPDRYGIHYGSPPDPGAAFVRDSETQIAVLYDLDPGQVLDVGDIIRRLPQGASQ